MNGATVYDDLKYVCSAYLPEDLPEYLLVIFLDVCLGLLRCNSLQYGREASPTLRARRLALRPPMQTLKAESVPLTKRWHKKNKPSESIQTRAVAVNSQKKELGRGG